MVNVSAAVNATAGVYPGTTPAAAASSGDGLSTAERRAVARMQQRDREVRAHEQAHVVADGALVRGAASFTYELGPDGRRYAVGGEVHIDTSAGHTPEETLDKARQIRAAALAPADPSAQDRQVAAAAERLAAEAGARIARGESAEGEPEIDIFSPPGSNARAFARFFSHGLDPAPIGTRVDVYA